MERSMVKESLLEPMVHRSKEFSKMTYYGKVKEHQSMKTRTMKTRTIKTRTLTLVQSKMENRMVKES